MSRTNYYYDPPNSFNVVDEPGEVCDGCGELDRIGKAGTLIQMPFDASHEEYGGEEGDIHTHLECAIAARDEYKRCYEEADAAIKRYQFLGRTFL